MEKYNVGGKEYNVTGHVNVTDKKGNTVGKLPIVDIPMMSDFKWQMSGIESRLNTPELYRKIENVTNVIYKLEKWCEEHINQATEKEIEVFKSLKQRIKNELGANNEYDMLEVASA